MISTSANSARRSRRIASETMLRPVSSATKSAIAAAPAATKQIAATAEPNARRTPTGRKRLTSRTTVAPPSVIRIGESAAQSIVGAVNSTRTELPTAAR